MVPSGTARNLEMADGARFEPTVDLRPTPVFKTGAFNRSATHPASGAGLGPAPCSSRLIVLG